MSLRYLIICLSVFLSGFAFGEPTLKEGFQVHPKDCDFVVTFPGKPKENITSPPNSEPYVSYEYHSRLGYMLRTECMSLDEQSLVALKSNTKNKLISFANANGLSNPEVSEYKNPTVGKITRLRGYKVVGGDNAIYVNRIVFGKTSFITLQTAGAANTYPQKGVVEFIDSLQFYSQPIASVNLAPAEIRNGLKIGHRNTCIPTIRKQYADYGQSLNYEKILRYCTCLGSLYFDGFSMGDYEHIQTTGNLPLKIQVQRAEFQDACATQYLEK